MIIDGIISGDQQMILDGLTKFGTGIWKIITGIVQTIVGIIGMLVTGVVDLVVAGAKWIYDHVIMPIENWVETKIRRPIKDKIADAINFAKAQFNGWKTNISTFVSTVGNLFATLWNKMLSGFAKSWNKIAGALNKVGGKLGLPSNVPYVNSYAVGTNYVPEDQLAFIHKGEAVVPKKYNNSGYSPVSNDETNALLADVITAINNIEINPYTTVKDVGKASLSYINAKSRQLGESVVV